MRILGLGFLAVLVALAGCKRGGDLPTSMPKGYEAIDKAFGFKPSDLISRGSSVSVPLVEFRAAGAYALYPFSTDCNGRFSLGAGTIYTEDGVIKETSKPLNNSEIRARPEYSPVAEMVCAFAKANKAVPDPFVAADAVALLYGAQGSNGKASWQTKLDGEDTQFGVYSVLDGEFNDRGVRRHYLLTVAENQTCTAHACTGGYVGISVFRFENGKWKLEKHEPALFQSGHSGVVLQDHSVTSNNDPNRPLFQINMPCFGNGECNTPVKFVGWTGTEFKVVLDRELASNIGFGGCTPGDACTLWQGEFSLGEKKQDNLPDLTFHRYGQEVDEKTGVPVSIDDTTVYRYDRTKMIYTVFSNKAEPRTPLAPAATEEEAGKEAEIEPSAATTETSAKPAANPRQDWIARCEAGHRKFVTSAGNTVGLNESEAARLCNCIYNASPQSEAAFTSARNTCFGNL